MRRQLKSTDRLTELLAFFDDLTKDSRPPLLKLFRTENYGYLYDTGTNKILSCSDLELGLISNLYSFRATEALTRTQQSHGPADYLHTLEVIRAAIDEKNILKSKPAVQFGLSAHFGNLDDLVTKSLRMIILEITERCNLRCGYCIYDPHYARQRDHGSHDMELGTAHEAIRLLLKSSEDCDQVGITFYGGEPLLRYSMIKKCVEYARHLFINKEIGFSLTTNGTLLTKEMAEYFASEQFGITVSIDGPQDIHDEYRKDSSGNGSFMQASAGLRELLSAYDNHQKLRLSMVYAPPFTEEKVNRISQLWDENPWIPKNMAANITYAELSQNNEGAGQLPQVDYSLCTWAKREYLEAYKNGIKAHPLATNIIEGNLIKIVQRPIFNQPLNRYNLNGCCIPCSRKVHVSADGGLSLCERIGFAPMVGTVSSGVDLSYLRRTYVDAYADKSLSACAGCWAIQLCGICYAHAYKDFRFDLDTKNSNCRIERFTILEMLKLYCELLEVNEHGLDHLMNVKVV